MLFFIELKTHFSTFLLYIVLLSPAFIIPPNLIEMRIFILLRFKFVYNFIMKINKNNPTNKFFNFYFLNYSILYLNTVGNVVTIYNIDIHSL